MSTAFTFIKKHWLTLGLLIGSLIAVNWIVTNKRAPGSMTVIEAQSMDMTDMKAPVGVMPIAVEAVQLRSLDGGKSFPATISALSEEDVVARVPGRLSGVLVYPGDRVRAGQLLATIDAPEYDSERRKAEAMSGAKSSEVVSAERMIAHHRNVLGAANATVDAAKTAKARAGTDVEAASLELAKSQDELRAAKAAKDERQAELTYAEQDLARERDLYKKGAISLDEAQTSQRDHDAAASRVQSAQAATGSAGQSVRIAEKHLVAAKQMVIEADAQVAIATAAAGQAQEGIAQAHADANAKRFEASAATSAVASASTFADYRQLKALADGVVSERLISPGTPVSAGQVILRIKSMGEVRVQADVPQTLSGSIRMGVPVLIRTDAGERNALLTSVFPSVDPQTRTFRVEALLSNADGTLKPGMFAHLEIRSGGNQVLAVQSVAVQEGDSGKYVWTVQNKAGTGKADWTCTMHPQVSEKGPGKCPICGMDLTLREKGGSLMAHRTSVTVSRTAGDYTEVVTGLKEGDQVIWAGLDNLIEGTPVKPTPWGDGGPKELPAEGDTAKPPMKGMPGMEGMKMPEDKATGGVPSRPSTPKAQLVSKVQYVCPMDKDVVSDRPGKCPKCGMDLVKREPTK